MTAESFTVNQSVTYSTSEAAWILGVSKKTVMRRCRQLGVGIQRNSGYWTFSSEDVKAMRSVGRMAGKGPLRSPMIP